MACVWFTHINEDNLFLAFNIYNVNVSIQFSKVTLWLKAVFKVKSSNEMDRKYHLNNYFKKILRASFKRNKTAMVKNILSNPAH